MPLRNFMVFFKRLLVAMAATPMDDLNDNQIMFYFLGL